MVLEKFTGFFKKKDPLSTKGLEEFTIPEQERILNRISSKEAELRERRAEAVAERRIRRLEGRSRVDRENKPIDVGGKLRSFKAHRQGNLARRAARQKDFEDKEKAFREGKLAVKPVGVQATIKRMTPQEANNQGKLNIKPIKLKAPTGLL